jgi:L-alanine-DL-glutamate epimerase-like enolase superfamily enzyme
LLLPRGSLMASNLDTA